MEHQCIIKKSIRFIKCANRDVISRELIGQFYQCTAFQIEYFANYSVISPRTQNCQSWRSVRNSLAITLTVLRYSSGNVSWSV